MPKLYEMPRKVNVRIMDENVKVPPGAYPLSKGDVIHFDHVDGMYSYCTLPNGELVHLAAWTEVERA